VPKKKASKKKSGRTKKLAGLSKKVDAQKNIVKIPIHAFAAENLYTYGNYVVQERAVPDYRDGLKPVHRYILWAMKELGLVPTGKFNKAARTVGDVLGKYHPHGDQACYGAMVSLANMKPNLVSGQGNWGSPVDREAAMRYTEGRLGAYSQIYLLDKDYLKTVPMVPNFSNEFNVPLYLPSTLPTMCIIGSSGIGFGIASSNPPFEMEGVVQLVLAGLKSLDKGRKINLKMCSQYLKISYPFQCEQVSGDEEFAELLDTGKGSIKFRPTINADWDNKVVEVTSYSPGFRSKASVSTKLEKLNSLPSVARAGDDSSIKNPKSGAYGAYYYVKPVRGISEDDFYDLAEKVSSILTATESYDLGFTVRHVGKDNAFFKSGFVTFFNNWIKYRLNLELKMIKVIIQELDLQIEKLDLLVFAVDNRAAIIKCLDSKDPDTTLSNKLKISMEKSKAILNLQVRKLAKLEKSALVTEIKKLRLAIKGLKPD
jgi:topoisomerase-4 subunit A